jgi:glycosyltransferase involved in cell wall biosynthesis
MKNKQTIMSFTSMGDYRIGVMLEVKKLFGNELTIFSGTVAFDPTIKLINEEDLPHWPLKNIYLFKRKFLIQIIPIRDYIKCDVLLLDLNPRIINVWLLTLLRRMLGKPTILWGHAWPRTGKGSRSDFIRGLLRKMSKNIIVYTETQSNELSGYDNDLVVTSAPNALYRKEQMEFISDNNRNDIIYVGRIVKEKKPEMLLNAFVKACSNSEFLARLIFVGSGDELSSLKTIVDNLQESVKIRIVFCGHISNHKTLSELYSNAFISVSPGYVGLSITQSFSFGIPMLISKDELHAPEIEAAVEGVNAEFFETNNIDNLSSKLIQLYQNRADIESKGRKIVEMCQEQYSVENMAAKIQQSITKCL